MKKDFEAKGFGGSWIGYMSNLAKQHGGINLAQGLPGFDPPRELLEELNLVITMPVHQYPSGNGHPLLVDCIEKMYSAHNDFNPAQVTVLQGATEAISLVYTYLHFRFSGSMVSLAFDPIYESYLHLPRIYGDRLLRMEYLSDGQIDWDMLESLIGKESVRLVFVNSPGNPSGRIWTADEIDALRSLAHKYDFYILFDGVYSELYFHDQAPAVPLNNLSDRFFFVSSFSKMLSITGWRIGFLIASEEHSSRIRDIHDYTGLCASSILQYAIANYLINNAFGQPYLEWISDQLRQSLNQLCDPLKSMGFLFVRPESGYFIWAQVPERIGTGKDFCIELFNKQKVAMVPGVHFSDQGEKYIRINFARHVSELQEAIGRIQHFLTP